MTDSALFSHTIHFVAPQHSGALDQASQQGNGELPAELLHGSSMLLYFLYDKPDLLVLHR